LAWLVKAGTMKRKLKWIVVFILVLFVGLGAFLFLLPRDRITADSWKQIRIGMTEKEVEDILGGPGMSDEEMWGHFEDDFKKLGKVRFKMTDFGYKSRRKIWMDTQTHGLADMVSSEFIFSKAKSVASVSRMGFS
jgi:hypothetical protein